jgi:hypothetical protein
VDRGPRPHGYLIELLARQHAVQAGLVGASMGGILSIGRGADPHVKHRRLSAAARQMPVIGQCCNLIRCRPEFTKGEGR